MILEGVLFKLCTPRIYIEKTISQRKKINMWPIAVFYLPIGSHEVQFVSRGVVGDIEKLLTTLFVFDTSFGLYAIQSISSEGSIFM